MRFYRQNFRPTPTSYSPSDHMMDPGVPDYANLAAVCGFQVAKESSTGCIPPMCCACSSPCRTQASPTRCGRSRLNFTTSPPKSAFAHANHGRVYAGASPDRKDSCINQEPGTAAAALSVASARAISTSEVEVRARIVILIGQIVPAPVCGEPTPSPARPEAYHGLVALESM